MASAVALAEGYGNLGNGSLAVSIEKFGSVEDYAVVLLSCAGKEARNIDKRHQGNVEGVAEANEAGTLARCVAVEHACEVLGLVCHDAYCLSVEAGEAYYEVLGVVALYFEELAVVDYSADYLVHVVRPVGRIGYDFVKRVFQTVDGVVAFNKRSLFEVVLGNVAEEFAYDFDSVFAVFCGKVAYAALLRVNFGSAEGVLAHIFASHGLYHLGACEEHIGYALGHNGEVGEGGGVHRAAGARAENAGNLRNHAGGHDVTLENFGITGKGVDAFLNTCAARVVESDYGCAHLHGHIHYLAYLQSHCFR